MWFRRWRARRGLSLHDSQVDGLELTTSVVDPHGPISTLLARSVRTAGLETVPVPRATRRPAAACKAAYGLMAHPALLDRAPHDALLLPTFSSAWIGLCGSKCRSHLSHGLVPRQAPRSTRRLEVPTQHLCNSRSPLPAAEAPCPTVGPRAHLDLQAGPRTLLLGRHQPDLAVHESGQPVDLVQNRLQLHASLSSGRGWRRPPSCCCVGFGARLNAAHSVFREARLTPHPSYPA